MVFVGEGKRWECEHTVPHHRPTQSQWSDQCDEMDLKRHWMLCGVRWLRFYDSL